MGIANSQTQFKTVLPTYKIVRPISSRKKVIARIKMVDGELLNGFIYFRPTISYIRDGLNQNEDAFIAMTHVKDGNGSEIPSTLLLNYTHIVFVAIPTHSEEGISALPVQDGEVPSRKVGVFIRTIGGVVFSGNIYLRNTILRAKDELNLKDRQFIALTDVQAQNQPPVNQVYFFNKHHITFMAVSNDQVDNFY